MNPELHISAFFMVHNNKENPGGVHKSRPK
jgi:hypothetical protein